jgi:beta-glucosidase
MEADKPKTNVFPKNFMWGASTAAHQVEGGNYNQWTVWELAHAKQLAKTAAERLRHVSPVWDEIKKEAEDPENYVSGKGTGHYERYKEDFALLQRLNLNSFRFGIEWSRLEPKEGEWNEAAVQHYHDYIAELNRRGIEPIMNIWHWTMPIWFSDKGGFKKAANLRHWRNFVQKVAEEYGKNVSNVITINEPNVYSSFSYVTGEWPPQEKNWWSGIVVYWHLVRAHKQAYKILKSENPQLQVGIAAQLANIQAKRPHNMFDEFSTKVMRYFWNWWFLRRIRKQQDFVGINYYFSDYYTGLLKRENPRVPINDMGWYMEPEGLYPLLLRAWVHYKKPIIVTENGVADMHDEYRRWWLEESIVAMERAISEGVDLRGYFHWALLDNFEWAYGWWPKFGLIAVDRKHGNERSIRPSAKWLAERIEKLN